MAFTRLYGGARRNGWNEARVDTVLLHGWHRVRNTAGEAARTAGILEGLLHGIAECWARESPRPEHVVLDEHVGGRLREHLGPVAGVIARPADPARLVAPARARAGPLTVLAWQRRCSLGVRIARVRAGAYPWRR